MDFSTSYINDLDDINDIDDIEDLNSRAVMLLQQNKHKEATFWLRRGLRSLASREQATDDAQQQNLHTHHASKKCVDSIDVESHEARPAYSVEIPIMPVSLGNVFVVFNRAFQLSDYGVLKTSADCTKASATLFYNMGLAWHDLGAQENNTAAFNKALVAYESAYTLLSQQCNDSFSYLVMLALCNNMAHIHSYFFNLKEAKKCRDLIPRILACISPGTSSDNYDFFLSEAILLESGQELSFAPAA